MEPGHFQIRNPLNEVWMRDVLQLTGPLNPYPQGPLGVIQE
jgi:hypothetical protein